MSTNKPQEPADRGFRRTTATAHDATQCATTGDFRRICPNCSAELWDKAEDL